MSFKRSIARKEPKTRDLGWDGPSWESLEPKGANQKIFYETLLNLCARARSANPKNADPLIPLDDIRVECMKRMDRRRFSETKNALIKREVIAIVKWYGSDIEYVDPMGPSRFETCRDRNYQPFDRKLNRITGEIRVHKKSRIYHFDRRNAHKWDDRDYVSYFDDSIKIGSPIIYGNPSPEPNYEDVLAGRTKLTTSDLSYDPSKTQIIEDEPDHYGVYGWPVIQCPVVRN